MSNTITFSVTASVPRAFSAGAAAAAARKQQSLEPEHLLWTLLSSKQTTAFRVLDDLGLVDAQTSESLDESFGVNRSIDTQEPLVLQRGGRLRPLMAASVRYAHEGTNDMIYSANLVYGMIQAVPGPAFDALRKRVGPSQIQEAVLASSRHHEEIWKREHEERPGGFGWEITSSHYKQIFDEISRTYVEIPFT